MLKKDSRQQCLYIVTITLMKVTLLRSSWGGGAEKDIHWSSPSPKDLEQCAVLSWHAFSEQCMGIICPTRKCQSYLQIRMRNFLPPMSTYTHVSGVVLDNIISSSSDLHIEASHKEEKGIKPVLLAYVYGQHFLSMLAIKSLLSGLNTRYLNSQFAFH